MIAEHIIILSFLIIKCETAKILAVSQPITNHQMVFYPLVKELATRGHEIVFITSNPGHLDGKTSDNFQEIDLSDISNKMLKKYFNLSINNIDELMFIDPEAKIAISLKLFEEQMKSDQVQNLIKHHKTFDLLILPASFRPAMIWSHIYKAPVMQLSTPGIGFGIPENVGSPIDSILYPENTSRRIYNLSVWEIFTELYNRYTAINVVDAYEVKENEVMKRIFGSDIPLLSELKHNVEVLLLNSNNFWERNRPLPRNAVYFGHVTHNSGSKLPQELKSFLDSSQGAIYVNLGTKDSSRLSTATIELLLEVFSELSYNVLWKLDLGRLNGLPQNVMMRKWFPETDIFRHPNLKLVITHGDVQITEEAMEAGMPLIGVRKLGNQMFNVEHYTQYGIGLHFDMDTLDKKEFKSSVFKVIENASYKDNVLRLRTLINDTKFSSLERAILWTEYVLKHSSTAHFKSAAFNMSWSEYFELELFSIIISSVLILLTCIWLVFKMLIKKFEAMIASQARTEEI